MTGQRIQTRTVNYTCGDMHMEGDLFRPDLTADRPAVLVFPEGFGLGEHARSRAKRIAELGYVAMACDLHGNARVIESSDEAFRVLGPLSKDASEIRKRAASALNALLSQDGVAKDCVAAVGFCFGGTMALELARSGADLRAVVGFHCGLATTRPEDAPNIKARILVCIGSDDPVVPPEQRAAFEREMRASRVQWQLNVYGGAVHSFTDPAADKRGQMEAFRYDPEADRLSWDAMTRLFRNVL
ncbi:MAG: dienelactone hydrolase family protein [Flavobacteriaceae bacterium]